MFMQMLVCGLAFVYLRVDGHNHGLCVCRREYHHVWTLDVVLIDGFQLVVAKRKSQYVKVRFPRLG